MKCKVRVSFLGCNCGCSPYQMMTFVSDTQDYAIRAAATYCTEHAHSGSGDPLSLIKAPSEVLTLARNVIKIVQNIKELEKLSEELKFSKAATKWAMDFLGVKSLPLKKKQEMKKVERSLVMSRIKIEILKKEVIGLISYPDNTVSLESPPVGKNG